MTIIDEELVIVNDEWVDTPCESFFDRQPCDSSAQWIVHRRPCAGCGRNPKMFCTEHKDRLVSQNDQKVYCPVCETVFTSKVYYVEAIDG